MASAKRLSKKSKTSGLSDQAKKRLMIGAGCVVLAVGGWWGYFSFTTIAPPDLNKLDTSPAAAEQVVSYYGDPRGLIRLPVERQEQYLTQVYQKFSQGEPRARLIQELNQMSSSERETMQAVIFEITRKHVAEMAEGYMNTPFSQRAQYIDKAISNLESVRHELGGGTAANSVAAPLKKGMPIGKDELAKMLVTRTDGPERAKAEPFINAMADRYKEMKNPDIQRRFKTP